MTETPFEEWIECPLCHGTGKHESGEENFEPEFYGISLKCPRCDGVGEIDPKTVANHTGAKP